MNFDELSEEVFRLHRAGSYADALDLITDPGGEVARGHGATLTYWRACLLSLLDRPRDALGELREGAASGQWWAPSILEGDPDLERVRLEESFGAIVAASDGQWRASEATPRAELVAVSRPRGDARAAMVVLHGGRGSVEDIADTWAPAVELGCVLAIPGRGQHLTSDGDFRNWTDPAQTRDAVRTAIEAAGPTSAPVVIAGFSAGGREALRIGLSGEPVEAAGTIAFAPGPLDPDGADMTRAPHLRAWLFVGEDDWVLDGAVRLVDELRARGSSVALERAPGLGHELPADLAPRLSEALDHVLGAD